MRRRHAHVRGRLASVLAPTLSLGLRLAASELEPASETVRPLPAVVAAGQVPMPAHLRAALGRPEGTTGCTNLLALSAWHRETPLPGRPGRLVLAYSNRLDQAVYAPRRLYAHDGTDGVLLFRVEADGARTRVPLPGRPEVRPYAAMRPGRATPWPVPLPLETQNLLAGAQGLSVAYHCATVKAPTGSVEAWVEAGPLPVAPSGADHPEPLTQSEWAAWVLGWSQQSQQGVGLWPQDVLEDHPDAAPFFPGVVLDASLPEAFRVHFAEWMPGVDAWDPCVLAAVTNAPDKDAPLVLAMLNVLRRSGGPSPEERAARRAVNQTLYVMSQDAQNPLLFRLHAAHMFRVGTPYQDFMVRTEPHFKLLAADELRGVGGRDFPTVPRTEVRAGLTALVSDATPFVAGPLAGKYPANATVGQVASIILADLEAMWAAEPYEER